MNNPEKEYDIGRHIQSLNAVQNQLEKLIQKSHFEKGDVRISIFHNSVDMIRVCITIMNIIHSVQLGRISLETLCSLLGIKSQSGSGTPKEELEKFFSMAIQFLRFSLITLIHFQIENYLKIVLSKIYNTTTSEQFYKIAESLLSKADIPDKEIKLKILNTLGSMRNTYHSNGTHTKESYTIIVNDMQFEFKKGEVCKCADWQHIQILLSEIFKIIEEINTCPEVSKLKENIGNIYYPQNG